MSTRLTLLLELTAAVFVAGGVLAVPAYLLVGPMAVEGVAWGVLLCLIPGAMLSLHTAMVHTVSPPMTMLFLPMSLRLAVVAIGGLAMCVNRPEMRGATFLLWLIPLYLVALAVETRQALRTEGSAAKPTSTLPGPHTASST